MTSIEKLINVIKEEPAFTIAIFDILFLITPGIACIFFYKNDLFLSLDWIKLVLLSVSITSSLSFFNIMMFDSIYNKDNKNEKSFFIDLSIGIILSGMIIYAIIFVAYILSLSLRHSVYGLGGIEFIFFAHALYTDYKAKSIKKS